MSRNMTPCAAAFRFGNLAACAALLSLADLSSAGDAPADVLAKAITSKAGIRAGVCEMPRVGDGTLAVALAKAGVTLVHGLAPETKAADGARRPAIEAGFMGVRVMIETGTPAASPLADWVADLVVVADATDANLKELAPAELWRVLSPYRGVAMIGNPDTAKAGLTRPALETWAKQLGGAAEIVEDTSGLWAFVRKGPEKGMDEWTHFQHNGGNNPVSSDAVLKPPYDIQYVTPPFTGAGGSSRVAGGRLFEMEGQQFKHPASASLVGTLWCRSAYNGQILWQMPLPKSVDAKQLTAVAMADAFYLLDGDKPGVRVIDPETGVLRRTLSLGKEGEQCKWIAIDGDRLLAVIGKLAPAYPAGATYHGLREPTDPPVLIRAGKLNHGLRVCAYDLAAGKTLWSHEAAPDLIDPRAIAAWDGKVAFLVEDKAYASPEGERQAEKVIGQGLVCLDTASGKSLWENKDLQLGKLERQYQYIFGREYYPGLIASKDGVRLRLMGIYNNDILVFDPATGVLRWKIDKRDACPGTFAGFFQDGKYYHQFVFDSRTGEKDETIITKDIWDGGCGVRTSSPAGIFGNSNRQSVGMAVKSDCHMGSFVAGGLLNVPRGWCDCGGVWRGTFAFAPRGKGDVHADVPGERLTQGPAYASDPQSAIGNLQSNDWPTYRHDNDRTAGSPVAVSTDAKVLWQYAPPTPYSYVAEHEVYAMRRQDQPTEPVSARGFVFFGGSDGKVAALASETGKEVWTYWTCGRVYAPPTVWDGRVYAGSCDGYVYCLDARTGELAWRFRAAPRDQRIMNAMRLESRWPILTGVLVHEGVAYFAAGLVDIQGVHLYALDARTAAVRWHNFTAGKSGGDLDPGLKPDGFMTVMGSRLYVRQRGDLLSRFDLATGAKDPLPDYRLTKNAYGMFTRYWPLGREIAVLGNGFVLEGGRSFQHELNQRSGDRGWPSFYLVRFGLDGAVSHRCAIRLSAEAIIPPAFDKDGMALVPGGFGRYSHMGKRIESPRPRGTQGLMLLDMGKVLAQAQTVAERSRDFADKREMLQSAALDGSGSGANGFGKDSVQNPPEMYRNLPAFRWQFEDPWVQVNAVALAKNAVVITRGLQDRGQKGGAADEYEKWTVAALARDTGKVHWEHNLPCEPMLNGLCIDRDGRVFVTLRDGGAVCIGSSSR